MHPISHPLGIERDDTNQWLDRNKGHFTLGLLGKPLCLQAMCLHKQHITCIFDSTINVSTTSICTFQAPYCWKNGEQEDSTCEKDSPITQQTTVCTMEWANDNPILLPTSPQTRQGDRVGRYTISNHLSTPWNWSIAPFHNIEGMAQFFKPWEIWSNFEQT